VREFGFGEHNRPLVQLLFAIFVGFAAGFLGFLPLLRFKPNFGFLSFLS
jgi:hypothetical protein